MLGGVSSMLGSAASQLAAPALMAVAGGAAKLLGSSGRFPGVWIKRQREVFDLHVSNHLLLSVYLSITLSIALVSP